MNCSPEGLIGEENAKRRTMTEKPKKSTLETKRLCYHQKIRQTQKLGPFSDVFLFMKIAFF